MPHAFLRPRMMSINIESSASNTIRSALMKENEIVRGVQGSRYLWGSRLSACFVLKIELQMVEGEKREGVQTQNKAHRTSDPRTL